MQQRLQQANDILATVMRNLQQLELSQQTTGQAGHYSHFIVYSFCDCRFLICLFCVNVALTGEINIFHKRAYMCGLSSLVVYS